MIDERLDNLVTGQNFVLTAVVLHIGNESDGHYITIYRDANQRWVELDDETTNKGISHQLATEQLKKHAYLCLYRECNWSTEPDDKSAWPIYAVCKHLTCTINYYIKTKQFYY